jgi:hypothetical protein
MARYHNHGNFRYLVLKTRDARKGNRKFKGNPIKIIGKRRSKKRE